MKPPRESVYVALANLVFTQPEIVANFVTTGRFLYHHEQVPGGESAMPAIFLVQHPGETHQRMGRGMEPKRTLRCSFVMYFYTGAPSDLTILPATVCNIGLDAIDDAINLPVNPDNVQTLGGLVEHVYTEGTVAIAEGLLQNVSIVAVPITMLLP
jgi:hypothetical protein